jgi:hypothetical protein
MAPCGTRNEQEVDTDSGVNGCRLLLFVRPSGHRAYCLGLVLHAGMHSSAKDCEHHRLS